MKVLNLFRSLGGVFLIAVGAVVAALVGRYSVGWLFIPTFIAFETAAFYIYYRAVFGGGKRKSG